MPVTLGDPQGNEIEVRQGLAPGQTIVTAGVHLLQPGQKVKPMQNATSAQPAQSAKPASNPASNPGAAAGSKG
ncbi:hypothetical protein D3C71_2074160 [compost metagenome]